MIELHNTVYLGSATPSEGGGGTGTSDYPDLTNKPKVNGTTLNGNKTSTQLGINPVIELTGESGTLTSDQIALVTRDDSGVMLLNDGEYYKLYEDATTYRTFINITTPTTTSHVLKSIYVNVTSGAANYGSWTLEEETLTGEDWTFTLEDDTTVTKTVMIVS